MANLTFDAACVFNSTGNRAGTLRVYYSSDGATWNELTGTGLPFTATNNVASSAAVSVSLPPALDNMATVKLRFYYHNGTGGTTGSRPKISVDNVLVTSSGVGDTTAPVITTYTPANNATGVSATTNLVAQFSEPVAKLTGDISVKLVSDNSTVMTIPVAGSAVVVAGSTATITLPSILAGTTAYYVNLAPGSFEDVAGNDFTGITDAASWTFTTGTVDSVAPSITVLSPLDNSATAFPTSNLVVTYDENISAGSGSVVIKKVSDDSVVDTITVPGTQVQVAGATATLNPSVVLQYATAYYVEISAGAFKDAANNGTLVVSGNSTWNFTTRSAPSLVISQYYEGLTSADRYVELKNLTGSPLLLTGYRLAVWSDTAPSDNEGWKSGTNTSTRVTSLDGLTIPANGSFLVAETGAATPLMRPTIPTSFP